MATTSDDIALVGGGLGGLMLGRSLADSDFSNKLLVRWLTRKQPGASQPDFRVPVYAGADLSLAHGSGEAVMASRMSRMLNRNGIGSYYVNTNGRFNDEGIARGEVSNSTWYGDAVKRNPRLWSDNTRIDGSRLGSLWRLKTDVGGKQSNALRDIVGAMTGAGVSQRKAIRLLRSGAFDNFTPGELLDTFKLVGKQGILNIAAGRDHIAPYAALGHKHYWGTDLPYLLSGEAGMNYSTLAGNEAAKSVGENTYAYPRSPHTRNLALDTQFQANYRSPSDQLLPGSGMYDPGFGRRSRLGRMWKYYMPKALGGGERAAYMKAIRDIAVQNGIDPSTLTPGTKFMLISTGAAGANAAEKVRLVAKAFERDPNVRIILQYGKKNPLSEGAGLDLYTNNGVMDEVRRINARRPEFILHGDRLPGYDVLARNVDLHGTYGGSSTITEALANTNPTVTMTDTFLNRGNNNYGTARRGIQQVDAAATALGREKARLLHSGVSLEDALARSINTRDSGEGAIHRLGPTIKALGLENADYGKIERDAVQKLRDAMYNSPGRFNRKTVSAVNALLKERGARDRTFVDAVRKAVLHAVDKHDAGRYGAMRPGARKAFSGLMRGMFSTAAGRRIGGPLALLASVGGGIGARALGRLIAKKRGGK